MRLLALVSTYCPYIRKLDWEKKNNKNFCIDSLKYATSEEYMVEEGQEVLIRMFWI